MNYDYYIEAFLDHVTQTWGFRQTEWEVGNEMNDPVNNWVAAELPKRFGSVEGFNAYMQLYRNIAQVVARYRTKHPELSIKIGGPAVTPAAFVPGWDRGVSWSVQLIDHAANEGLPCDFVSVHFYGNQLGEQQALAGIAEIKARIRDRGLRAGVSVSEWGLTGQNSPANLAPAAGSFALELLSALARAGVDDAIALYLAEPPNVPQKPALFTTNGTPTHTMLALEAIANLRGERLPCSTAPREAGCIASRGPDGGVDGLVWSSGWRSAPMVENALLIERPLSVSVAIGGLTGANRSFTVRNVETAGHPAPQMRALLAPALGQNQLLRIGGIGLPGSGYGRFTLVPAGSK